MSSDTFESDSEKGTPKNVKLPLPAMMMMKKGRAFLKKITMQDTTKGLELVLDSVNEAMTRFEALEDSIKHPKVSGNFVMRDEVEEQLFKDNQRLLVELEKIMLHMETIAREERVAGLKDSFNIAFICVLYLCLGLMIMSSPMDYLSKSFFLALSCFGFFLIGNKYIDVKTEFLRNGLSTDYSVEIDGTREKSKSSFHREAFASVGESPEDSYASDLAASRQRYESVYGDCLTRTATASVSDSRHRISVNKEKEQESKKAEQPEDDEEDQEILDDTAEDDIVETKELDPDMIKGMGFNFMEDSGVDFEKTLEDLSDDEKRKFHSFRTEVINAMKEVKVDRSKPFDTPDDFNMLRFLQADKYDEKLALKRLMSTVVWRQKTGLIQYPKRKPKDLEYYREIRPRQVIGRDKQNRPIVYEHIGNFFGNKDVPKGLSTQAWLKCYSYETLELFNEFRKASIANGKEVHKFVYIADLSKVKFSYVRKFSLITTLKNEVEIHFPECAGTIYVINSPSYIARVWKMIAKVLDPVVVSKIRIHHGVPTEILIDELGEDVVPVAFGGKNKIELRK